MKFAIFITSLLNLINEDYYLFLRKFKLQIQSLKSNAD